MSPSAGATEVCARAKASADRARMARLRLAGAVLALFATDMWSVSRVREIIGPWGPVPLAMITEPNGPLLVPVAAPAGFTDAFEKNVLYNRRVSKPMTAAGGRSKARERLLSTASR